MMPALHILSESAKTSDISVLESIDCSHHSVWDLHWSYYDEWISIETWTFGYYAMTLWLLFELPSALTALFWYHSYRMGVGVLITTRPPLTPCWLGGVGVPHDCSTHDFHWHHGGQGWPCGCWVMIKVPASTWPSLTRFQCGFAGFSFHPGELLKSRSPLGLCWWVWQWSWGHRLFCGACQK